MSLFLVTDLEKFIYLIIISLAHQWILCSEWVPSEWESKQLIKSSEVMHPATFSLEKAMLWIQDSYFSWKQQFGVKNILMMGLFLTNIQLFTL